MTNILSSTRTGILIALSGFMILSVGDGLVKSTGGHWPGIAVAALRYVFGTLGLGLFIAISRGREGFRVTRPGLQALRGAAVATATMGFFSGAQLMPLADATAIQFISPIFATLFSWFLLKEPANRIIWLTMLMALAGVEIVLRPNVALIGAAAMLPVIAALGIGLLVVLNRMATGTADVLALQFWLAFFATPLLLLATLAGHLSGIPAFHVPVPSFAVVLKCAGVAVTGTAAHWLIFEATRFAPAPVIAPTVYVQLIMAATIGLIFFGNGIDAISAAGMMLIVGSGLILWRGQRRVSIAGTPD